MRKRSFSSMLVFITLWFFLFTQAFAGQVVTQDAKDWAKKAISQEKSLKAISTPNSLAVLYFENKTGLAHLDPLQKGLTLMLITDLSKVETIDVIERVKFQALTDELELSESGLVDSDTAPRMGRLMGVQFLEGGELLKGQTAEIMINPDMLDVPNEIVLDQPSVSGNLSDLISMEKKLVFDIIKQMEITLTPAQETSLKKPLSASVAALMFLFRGINASDKGDYVLAGDMYDKALNADPDLEIAKNALQEVKNLGAETTQTEKKPEAQKPEAPSGETSEAAAKGGSGIGKTVLITVGLAAVVAGGVIAADALKKDDKEDEPDPTPPASDPGPPPTVPDNPQVDTVDPPPGTALDPYSGSITFTFTKPMTDQTYIMDTDANQGWPHRETWSNNNQELTIDWDSKDYCWRNCDPPRSESVTFGLSAFTDTDGNPLAGVTQFEFEIDCSSYYY